MKILIAIAIFFGLIAFWGTAGLKILIVVAIFFGLVLAWGWRGSRRYLQKLLEMAKEAEAAGKYEDAVYYYGETLLRGHPSPEICREKIRKLWKEHGPFDFFARRDGIVRRVEMDRGGELATFQETVSVIGRVTAGEAVRPPIV